MELSPGEFDSAFNDFDFRMSQWAEMQSKSVSKLFYQQWHELPAFRLPCMEKDVPIRITSNSEPIQEEGVEQLVFMVSTLLFTLYNNLLFGLIAGIIITLITHILIARISVPQFFL